MKKEPPLPTPAALPKCPTGITGLDESNLVMMHDTVPVSRTGVDPISNLTLNRSHR